MGKGIFAIFRTKADLERHDKQLRHDARRVTEIFTLDLVSIALGRMGFRETKFRELNKTLTEVYDEYMNQIAEDLKDDPEMVYSRELMDRELKQYTGKFFKPAEERYA